MSLDAIVLLGCRIEGRRRLSGAARRRAARAAAAWKEGAAPVIVVSGGKRWHGVREADALREFLVRQGVPRACVLAERCSQSTRQNARFSAELLHAFGATRVGVVTCDWHLPRALRAFGRAGLCATGIAAVSPPVGRSRRLLRTGSELLSSIWDQVLTIRSRLRDSCWTSLCSAALIASIGTGCGKRTPDVEANPALASASATASLESAPVGPARVVELLAAEHRRDSAAIHDDDLSGRNPLVRRRAARALARVGDARSAKLLTRMLSDEDGEVVAWAAYGLGYACRGRETATVRALLARAATLAAESGGGAAVELGADSALDTEGALCDALARCATQEAELSLRAWLLGSQERAEHAALALGRLASRTGRLDDASIVALLDAASRPQQRVTNALFAFTRLQTLSDSVQQRLWDVAQEALTAPGVARVFAVRALGRAGPQAAERLGSVVTDSSFTAGERSDAARELARLGPPGQRALGQVLAKLTSGPLNAETLVSPAWGPLQAVLEALEAPAQHNREALEKLAHLPVADDDSDALKLRTTWLRCRAADLLAQTATQGAALVGCDPETEGRTGALAMVRVLDRGRIRGGNHQRWRQLVAPGTDPIVREAALRLIPAHAEIPTPYEVLAEALRDQDLGVVATAAQVLAAYPDRASAARPAPDAEAPKDSLQPSPNRLTSPPHADVVAALTSAFRLERPADALQLRAALIDAAGALQLLTLKPSINEACSSSNPTLRQHAQAALRLLGEGNRECDQFSPDPDPPPEVYNPVSPAPRLRFVTTAGTVEIVLSSEFAPVSVARIVELARSGLYNGTTIHRVVPGFVVQFGDPRGDGFGGAGRVPLRCETSPVSFDSGHVGLALSGRDSGSSQLFVTLGAYPHLDGDYPWLGRAESGWERLAAGDVIQRVEVLE